MFTVTALQLAKIRPLLPRVHCSVFASPSGVPQSAALPRINYAFARPSGVALCRCSTLVALGPFFTPVACAGLPLARVAVSHLHALLAFPSHSCAFPALLLHGRTYVRGTTSAFRSRAMCRVYGRIGRRIARSTHHHRLRQTVTPSMWATDMYACSARACGMSFLTINSVVSLSSDRMPTIFPSMSDVSAAYWGADGDGRESAGPKVVRDLIFTVWPTRRGGLGAG